MKTPLLLVRCISSQSICSTEIVTAKNWRCSVAEDLLSWPANFNGDGFVNVNDLCDWEEHFGLDAGADADGDSDTDGTDFLAWQRQFGSELSGVVASSTAPEPNAMLQIAIAIGLGLFRRDHCANDQS